VLRSIQVIGRASGVLLLGLLAVGASPTAHGESPELTAAGPDGEAALHPIEVRNPPSLGTVDTGLRDASGASVGVACATCHDPHHPDALARKAEVPEDFHGGIAIEHGNLSCGSCHEPEDRTRLRLADGETLPLTDAHLLCGQCHGPQIRNFWKGSHGGGRGYWDRTKGPWIRNSCVACHPAHAPRYPIVMPAPPPNDRFLPTAHESPKESPDHE
jgi:hypothetical protein